MDRTFKQMCEFFNPKMNPDVMNGYVLHEVRGEGNNTGYDLKAMEERVDATLRKAYDGLFDGRLIYGGIERCTPQEEFEFATRPKNTKRTFELAPSDIYLVKVNLFFKISEGNIQSLGDNYLYLPRPSDAGSLRIGGPLFQLIPVVSDKVISPEGDYLFVRLEQYKMKFFKDINYPVVVDGDVVMHDVYWANIYKQKQGRKKLATTKALSTLVHYMLARLGFSGMFEKFAGFVPAVGYEDTVNENNFHPDTWHIIRSAHEVIKPNTVVGNYYLSSRLRLAIPKDRWNEATKALVHGFFYVIDAFPDVARLHPNDKQIGKTIADVLNHDFGWKLALGQIISDSEYTPGKIIQVVDEHFSSTDTYMDELSIEKLAEKGFFVKDFTELLGLIVTKFADLYVDSGKTQVVYGKYLDTMREMLYPITYAIYNTKYFLMKQATKGPNYNTVRDVFVRKFKPGPVFKLTSKGIVAEVANYSGDHKYFKFTSRLSQQESTPGTRSSKGRKTLSSAQHINTSLIMAGSVLFLSKKSPHPMSHINPFIMLDPYTGTILENPKYKNVLKEVDNMLEQKS